MIWPTSSSGRAACATRATCRTWSRSSGRRRTAWTCWTVSHTFPPPSEAGWRCHGIRLSRMVVGAGVDVSRDLTDVATRRPSSDFLGLSTNSTASSPGIHNFIAQLRRQPPSVERDEELRSAVARAWAERAALPPSNPRILCLSPSHRLTDHALLLLCREGQCVAGAARGHLPSGGGGLVRSAGPGARVAGGRQPDDVHTDRGLPPRWRERRGGVVQPGVEL